MAAQGFRGQPCPEPHSTLRTLHSFNLMFRPFGTPAASNPPPNLFGGSSTTSAGGFGGFGTPAPSTSTGLFGQPAAQSAPAASFTSGFGGGSAGALGGIGGAAMSTGTGNPSYTSTTDTEANMTIHLYCISAMPAYRGKSLEELRLEDYQAGKKTASAFPGTGGSTSGGFFGTQPAQSTGMFGGASTSTSPFGFGNKPAVPAAPSFGGFGTPAAPSNQFGQPAATTSTPSFGAFGQPAAQQTQPSGFGGFGQSMTQAQPAATPAFGGFGQAATQPAQSQPGSFFGQQQQAAPSPFGFGQQPQQPATTGNMFGQATPQSNPFGQSASGGMFGAKPATPTTGAFGGFGQPAQQAAPATTGAFNFQPSTTSASTSTGGFSFGQPAQQQATPATSGFSFGQAPAATTAPASTGLGGFSFGPSSTATTAPASGSMFNLPTAATKIGSGFNFPPSTSLGGTSTMGTMGTMGGIGLQQPSSALPLISPPDARLLSLKPPLPAGLESTKTTTETTPSTFKPATTASTQPARLATDFVARPGAFKLTKSSTSVATTSGGQLMTRMLPSVKKLSIPKSASVSENTAPVTETEEETSTANKHYGDYYMVPSMATLKRMSYSQLASVSNFTVGQHGIGQVRFLKPVDLTGIDLDAILDHMIVFGSNQVVVYPEDDFPERPPVGQGLNQPAEVRLERCWPTARSTRDPITEMGGERMRRHIERIKSVEGTHFVDFFPDTGTWVFTVDHF